jgi:hypothetical protein
VAVDYGVEILVGATPSDDKKADIVRRVLQSIDAHTLSIVYAASYSAGSSSTNEVTLTVTGGTVDFGIRVLVDESAFGTGKLAPLVRALIQALESESPTISHAAAYASGDRAYNLVITVT